MVFHYWPPVVPLEGTLTGNRTHASDPYKVFRLRRGPVGLQQLR